MKIGPFDLKKEILVVAEIGNNHEGSLAAAEDMIGLAAKAGAGAVKFQTIVPEKLVAASEKQRIEQLKRFQLSYEDFEKLSRAATREKVLFLSTPFDLESVDFLNPLVPAFKIASSDNNFLPLMERVARTGKPVILSSGLTEFEEIGSAKKFIEGVWKSKGIRQELAVLHCVTSYPTRPEEANLLAIRELEKLGCVVGYSDHTLGLEAAVISAALGARIIEKHFTISRTYSEFHDHQIAADPEEFAGLVRRVREVQVLLGDGIKKLQESEKQLLSKVRRSIVAGRPLAKGSVLEFKDLSWTRPFVGLAPGKEKQVLGRRLKRDLGPGEAIQLSDLE